VEAVNSPNPLSRTGSNALSAGLTLAVAVGLFAYGGLWLDERFGSTPWCLLVAVLLGFLGGLLHVIRALAPELWPFGKRADRNRPPEGGV
jgi:F0F1-type ATP synthase assembly protein I